jgi:pyruvate formate lyase activating enzyme
MTVIIQDGPTSISSSGRNASARDGRILHLQRLSTEDGPGIRTTVFFKGCPLACEWCHNPESISYDYQIQWLESRCIGCNTCLEVCTHESLSRDAGGIHRDRKRCVVCGACARECPSGAMELLGRSVGVDELVAEMLKDYAYFEKSGGGVTLSGGEPTLQPNFSAALLQRLRNAGVHTAVDTCGLGAFASLERLIPHVDLLLYDLKEMDPQLHRRFTGQSNRIILDNLLRLDELLARDYPELKLWIRTPLIPGRTARMENIAAIGAYLAEHLAGRVERWELCAFNNLCAEKYDRLNMDWAFAGVPLLSQDELDAFAACARSSGVDPEIVFASGAVRDEAVN